MPLATKGEHESSFGRSEREKPEQKVNANETFSLRSRADIRNYYFISDAYVEF